MWKARVRNRAIVFMHATISGGMPIEIGECGYPWPS